MFIFNIVRIVFYTHNNNNGMNIKMDNQNLINCNPKNKHAYITTTEAILYKNYIN